VLIEIDAHSLFSKYFSESGKRKLNDGHIIHISLYPVLVEI
jgi:hypothetical protein